MFSSFLSSRRNQAASPAAENGSDTNLPQSSRATSSTPGAQPSLGSHTTSSASNRNFLAALPRGGGVVWLSVDPRTGDPALYPEQAVVRLEQARRAGAPPSVPLAGLGGVYEGAMVEIDYSGDVHVQRTQNGRRDVRRVEVAAGQTEIVVHVVRERAWHIVDMAMPGISQERRISVSTGEVLRQDDGSNGSRRVDAPSDTSRVAALLFTKGKGKGKDTKGSSVFKIQDMTPAEKMSRDKAITEAVAKSDFSGLVGLWEWCRFAEVPEDLDSVPPEMWGVYSEEQNAEIEEAFRTLQLSVSVAVGIRTYEIMFDRPDGGKQVDPVMRKRRYVRRRVVTPQEQAAALRAAVADEAAALPPELADMECAICFASFKETPTIPVVKLAPCGHAFHGACVQHLADRRQHCPFCRSEVDWKASFENKPSAIAAPATNDDGEQLGRIQRPCLTTCATSYAQRGETKSLRFCVHNTSWQGCQFVWTGSVGLRRHLWFVVHSENSGFAIVSMGVGSVRCVC